MKMRITASYPLTALTVLLAVAALVAPVASARAEDDPNTPSTQTLTFSGTGPTTGTVTGRVGPDLEQTEYGAIYAPASSLWCTSGGHEGEPPTTTYVDGGSLAPDPDDSYHLDDVTVNLTGLAWGPGTGYCAAITATNAAGTTPSFPVTAPYATAAPVLSGSGQPGQPLTVDTGAWSHYLFAYSYTYQWYECPTETLCGMAIAGADGTTWTPGAADGGRYVYATVTAGSGSGSSAPAPSNEIAIAGGSSGGGGNAGGGGGAGGGSGANGGGNSGGGGNGTGAGPAKSQIAAALKGIGSPTGKQGTLAAILKGGGFDATFVAPGAGLLKIAWSVRKGGAEVVVARGSLKTSTAGKRSVKVKLTGTGHALLTRSGQHPSIVTKTSFEASGGTSAAAVGHFKLG